MSHRRAKRLRKILDVKGRAYSNEYKSSVRLQYKKYKKLHKENPLWKLPTLKHMHGSLWQ